MFNSFTPMEITVLIVFVFYLMFNIDTPEMIAEIVETPIGLLSIMVMIMYLLVTNQDIQILLGKIIYFLENKPVTKVRSVKTMLYLVNLADTILQETITSS